MWGRLLDLWHIRGGRLADAHDGGSEAGQVPPPLPRTSHESSRRPQGQGAQVGPQRGARRRSGGKHGVGAAPRGDQRGAGAHDHPLLAAGDDDPFIGAPAHHHSLLGIADHDSLFATGDDDAALAAAADDLFRYRVHPAGCERRRRRCRQPGRPERRRRLPLGRRCLTPQADRSARLDVYIW
jgi:hypothetical protein